MSSDTPAVEAPPSNPWRGRVPAPLEAPLAQHLDGLTREAPAAVQAATLDALLRRLRSVDEDGLRVATRPPGVLGAYTTRTPGGAARPYVTVLHALAPLEASCSCPDFRRASLGLCKHLLAVLSLLGERPRCGPGACASRPSILWGCAGTRCGP